MDIILPILLTATTPSYASVHFARPYDLKEGTMALRLQFVRPTFFLGVPRVWEKIADRLAVAGQKLRELPLTKSGAWCCCFLKRDLSRWAKRDGMWSMSNQQYGMSGKFTI